MATTSSVKSLCKPRSQPARQTHRWQGGRGGRGCQASSLQPVVIKIFIHKKQQRQRQQQQQTKAQLGRGVARRGGGGGVQENNASSLTLRTLHGKRARSTTASTMMTSTTKIECTANMKKECEEREKERERGRHGEKKNNKREKNA